jgi:two-component system, OmpR family, sensor kinase
LRPDQASQPSCKSTSGSTGLGLAIVRAVVSARGGRLDLTSEPGRTTFLISLRARPSGRDG